VPKRPTVGGAERTVLEGCAADTARFHDRCSNLLRELLDELALAPDKPRTFSEIEDAVGWPRRRIVSVLGGVSHLRQTEFGGCRPYRLLDARDSASRRWGMWMDPTQARAVLAAAHRQLRPADWRASVAPRMRSYP
jgi:hypothetical protein